MENITIQLNSDLIKQAQEFFEECGMDLSTAVSVFFKQSLREQRIPFIIGDNYAYLEQEIPNAETIAAMEEIDEMIKSGKQPRFNSPEEMFKELGI